MSTTTIRFSNSTGSAGVDAMFFGTHWSLIRGDSITYSFPDHDSSWDGYAAGSEPTQGFAFLATRMEKNAVRTALQSWSNVANITFSEVDEQINGAGDIRFGYTRFDMAATEFAYSYPPKSDSTGGDIWLNAQMRSTFVGSYGSTGFASHVLRHEIGHALGLKHPGSSSAYVTATLAASENSIFNSIESYNILEGTPLRPDNIDRLPSTPMALDIDAIQALYGANTTFNDGDNLYRFNGQGRYLETLYDTGGIDTLQLLGKCASKIDLGPDQWSQIGIPVQIDHGTIEHANTVRIYKTTAIENAIGGNGSDVLIGNTLNNQLVGNRGNDTIQGLSGNDTLKGGPGDDEIVSGSGSDVIAGGQGADRFVFDTWTYVAASVASDLDTLLDFSEKDTLIFDTEIFLPLSSATTGNLVVGTSAQDDDDFLVYDPATGYLYFDQDGSGAVYYQQQVALIKGSGAMQLGFDDFGFI